MVLNNMQKRPRVAGTLGVLETVSVESEAVIVHLVQSEGSKGILMDDMEFNIKGVSGKEKKMDIHKSPCSATVNYS